MTCKEWIIGIVTDKVELIGNSLIQHGKENDRVYLMNLSKEDHANIVCLMENLAQNNGYSKIVAKIPASLKDYFIAKGFTDEACIENFFKGKENCLFLSKYYTSRRRKLTKIDDNEIYKIMKLCEEKVPSAKTPKLKEDFCIKSLNEEHVSQITEVYGETFKSYPFPIFNPDYILKTMEENVDYWGVFKGDKLTALSSSEMDLGNLNTEMTDFATLPEYRGNNLSYHLLEKMEKSAKAKGIKTAYTIARSKNAGINIIFAKRFYKFGGILINNTNICGNIQSMNVWYKTIN